MSLFGAENVLVVCYEDFAARHNLVFNEMLAFIGASSMDLPSKVLNRRVNARYSAPSEAILRVMNRLGYRSRVFDRLLIYFDRYLLVNGAKRSRESLLRNIPSKVLDKWAESNKRLKTETKIDLARNYYLL